MIYAMDKDYYVLKQYEAAAAAAGLGIACFGYISQLADAAEKRAPDVIFLEGELAALPGIVDDLRSKHPKIRLVFVTKTDQLTPVLLNLQPDGWMYKPVTADKLQAQLKRLR